MFKSDLLHAIIIALALLFTGLVISISFPVKKPECPPHYAFAPRLNLCLPGAVKPK